MNGFQLCTVPVGFLPITGRSPKGDIRYRQKTPYRVAAPVRRLRFDITRHYGVLPLPMSPASICADRYR